MATKQVNWGLLKYRLFSFAANNLEPNTTIRACYTTILHLRTTYTTTFLVAVHRWTSLQLVMQHAVQLVGQWCDLTEIC